MQIFIVQEVDKAQKDILLKNNKALPATVILLRQRRTSIFKTQYQVWEPVLYWKMAVRLTKRVPTSSKPAGEKNHAGAKTESRTSHKISLKN